MVDRKSIMKSFEKTLGMAELRALSTASLERSLNEKEFKRMMNLKRKWF